jgi:leader peptidase (prepilin peptidase)/N-methyltransferase
MALIISALGGLVFGSFLNVVVYRLPRGESLAAPASHCPHCSVPIKPYDNVPLFGWLLLRGRCRACSAPISLRYPLVELCTAALAAAIVLSRHTTRARALDLTLVAVLVAVALIDLDHRIIPNRITVPAAALAILIGLIADPARVPEQLIAGAAAGGFLLIFALVYPAGMGMGDVKLAAVMGLFLGRSVAVALAAGVLAGALGGMFVIARVGVARGRKTAVPFGPFLALGGLVAIFAGPAVVHWYLHGLA